MIDFAILRFCVQHIYGVYICIYLYIVLLLLYYLVAALVTQVQPDQSGGGGVAGLVTQVPRVNILYR